MTEFGTDADGNRVSFDPSAAMHTVIAGQTRSGKSVTAYAILVGLSRIPWVRFVGIDPTGVLLGPAAEGKSNDFALGTSPASLEHGLDVLRRLEAEMDRRISRLLKLGVDQVPPTAYRDPRLGWIACILEEYAGLLSAGDKKHGEEVRRIVGRLLREGAKAAISVNVILQRPEAAVLHDRAQYARKILLAVENGDSVRMVLPSATPEEVERVLRAPKGRGFYAVAGEEMRWFRSDLIEYPQYAQIVRINTKEKAPVFGVPNEEGA